jgi:hypothetical protein
MRNHLKELEIAGMVLIAIGLIIAYTAGKSYGSWPCGAGMLVLLIPYLFKAFHWKEYEQENKRNIWIIVLCILVIYFQILIFRL